MKKFLYVFSRATPLILSVAVFVFSLAILSDSRSYDPFLRAYPWASESIAPLPQELPAGWGLVVSDQKTYAVVSPEGWYYSEDENLTMCAAVRRSWQWYSAKRINRREGDPPAPKFPKWGSVIKSVSPETCSPEPKSP